MSNRRRFIKNIGLMGLAMGLAAVLKAEAYMSLQSNTLEYSLEDLMGKSHVQMHGEGFNLRKEPAAALHEMLQEASKSGFHPYIVSSYRSYQHQKRIWDNKYIKYTKQGLPPTEAIAKIIRFSTIPGTSRHHWGTDFDIIGSAKNIPSHPLHEKHFNPGGQYHDFKLWLNAHAQDFGFIEVYTNQSGRKGFAYEPWHYSYAPTACEMMSQYLSQNVIGQLYDADIQGAKHLTQDFLTKYLNENILDINPVLIP